MTRIVFAPEVAEDFERFFEHIAAHDPADAPVRLAAVEQAIDVLGPSPAIGRPMGRGLRELVIGRGAQGYVALYRWLPAVDTVFVLALRAQREAGYREDLG